MARAFWILAALCFAFPAFAQSPVYPVGAPPAAGLPPVAKTIATSTGAAIAAGSYTNASILNQSASAFIYCVWGGTAIASATAGQYTIAPLGGYVWDSSDPPPKSLALNCISTVSSPATVRAY